MKLRILLLAALIALPAMASQPARAQDKAIGARFKMAPNRWQMEKARKPGSRYLTGDNTLVRNGAVPQSHSFLGIDKQFLAKPQPRPVVRLPQVAARPSLPPQTASRVTPSSRPKPLKATPYNERFGKPQEPQAPVVAQNTNPINSTPGRLPAQPPQTSRKKVSGRMAPRASHHSSSRARRSRHVNAQLKKPSRPQARVAKAAQLKPIASYGAKHFSQGSFVNGYQRTSGNVHGRIINR